MTTSDVDDSCFQLYGTRSSAVQQDRDESSRAVNIKKDRVFLDGPKSFGELGLDPWQLSQLRSLSIKAPTPVQVACIPAILNGQHVIGASMTGSGKTAAFALPLLKILGEDLWGIFAVILTPTRELALQIAEQCGILGSSIGVTVSLVVGGMDMMQQATELARKPHLVIATPGRLADLIDAGSVDLKRVKAVVIDEADRVLDPLGSFAQTELPAILQAVNTNAQFLLFTATLSQACRDFVLSRPSSGEPPFIFQVNEEYGTVDAIKQMYLLIPSRVRDCYLYHLLQTLQNEHESIIIFVGKCKTCALLRFQLQLLGIPNCCSLHSQMPQRERIRSLSSFKSGRKRILISTDVGARGLDIPAVSLVINYDVPADARDYVHRIGRTGRAGKPGLALTLMSEMDCELVESIEKRIEKQLDEWPEPDEDKVLTSLKKVTDARQEASRKLEDSEFGAKRDINKKKWSKKDGK
jgi:ATP-dependent RNA helicase DDX49/DBP8